MEASQADAGQQQDSGEAQAPAQDAPQQQEQQQGSQIPDDVMSKLDALTEQVGEIRGAKDEEGGDPLDEYGDDNYGEQDYGQDPYADFPQNEYGDYIDPQTGQMVDPEQVEAQQFQQAVQEQVQQQVQQAIQPLLEQQQNQQIQQEAEALEKEFPALATQEGAEEALGKARDIAKQLGDDTLASNPALVRLVHLAGLAEQAAVGQTPAGGTQEAVAVEGGGGAIPSGIGDEDDPAAAILRAGGSGGQHLSGLG